ncbi:MAG: LPS-assembly protein LptD [Pontiellaceae bacterium]|nr:LPS-assembly protein LptD [Pontiellaceae bacterium]MBN2783419.1 LPS-assembly protein LptD [Pontiellaceae bacterium]
MRKILFLLSLVVPLSAVRASDLVVPREIPQTPFEIQAPRLEFTNDTIYASGGVTGRFENAVITADRLSGNKETGDIHLEGNIHFERDDVLWNGSVLDYNYLTQTGNFGPSSLNFDPVLMSVDHIERVSTNEYLLKGATFTTCSKAHPHYRVQVKQARLVDEKHLTAHGAVFYAGKVPIFYMPVWHQTLEKSIFTFRGGFGSEWGAYGLVRATVPLSDPFTSYTDLNLYQKRGVGLGQGFGWNSIDAEGLAEAFYLSDQDPHSKFNHKDLGSDRYRLRVENLQHFSDTHYVNTKWNYLSDPVVTKEYFRSEYRLYAQPENYVSWLYGNEFLGSEAFANYRLNDFYDNTDRVEYSLDFYRRRIPNSPFFFESQNSVSHLERVYSSTNAMIPFDSVRLDSLNTVYMPQRIGFVNVIPRGSYRATYYSKNAVDRSDEYRGIAGAGLEVSMQAARVLSDQEAWYGQGLRHKIEPYMDYMYADSSLKTNRIYRFDAADLLSDENRMRVGLRNVLQTRRSGRVARFMDVDLYTHYLVDRDGGSNNFGPLFVNARMPLTRRTVVDMDGEIDWNNGTVPFYNTRISHRRSDELKLSLEHLYWRRMDQSLWTPRVDLYPDGRFSFYGYARFEDQDQDIEEFSVGGYVNWCCMRYGLGYHFYDDNDHSIMFSIGISAFPDASISSGF